MPRILEENGIYSHLISDHSHYWKVDGSTYHTSYTSWEAVRGHEGDPWKGQVAEPEIPPNPTNVSQSAWRQEVWRQDWVNRKHMQCEEAMPQVKTLALGIEFIETNHKEDNWFLPIETLDPHEPFYAAALQRSVPPRL